MTERGQLQSVRRQIAQLYVLQEKFLRDDTTEYIEKEIKKLKILEELIANDIKKKGLDDINRRKASKPRT